MSLTPLEVAYQRLLVTEVVARLVHSALAPPSPIPWSQGHPRRGSPGAPGPKPVLREGWRAPYPRSRPEFSRVRASGLHRPERHRSAGRDPGPALTDGVRKAGRRDWDPEGARGEWSATGVKPSSVGGARGGQRRGGLTGDSGAGGRRRGRRGRRDPPASRRVSGSGGGSGRTGRGGPRTVAAAAAAPGEGRYPSLAP